VGRGRVKRKFEKGQIWLIYFIYWYENRTMKPLEIVLRRGEGMRKNDGGGEPNQGTS
jgi:hypothetical protein